MTHLYSVAFHVHQTAPKVDVSATRMIKEELYQSCFERRDFIVLTSTGAKITQSRVKTYRLLYSIQATAHGRGTSYLIPGFGHARTCRSDTERDTLPHGTHVKCGGEGCRLLRQTGSIVPLPHISLILGNAPNLCVVVSLSLKR